MLFFFPPLHFTLYTLHSAPIMTLDIMNFKNNQTHSRARFKACYSFVVVCNCIISFSFWWWEKYSKVIQFFLIISNHNVSKVKSQKLISKIIIFNIQFIYVQWVKFLCMNYMCNVPIIAVHCTLETINSKQ